MKVSSLDTNVGLAIGDFRIGVEENDFLLGVHHFGLLLSSMSSQLDFIPAGLEL